MKPSGGICVLTRSLGVCFADGHQFPGRVRSALATQDTRDGNALALSAVQAANALHVATYLTRPTTVSAQPPAQVAVGATLLVHSNEDEREQIAQTEDRSERAQDGAPGTPGEEHG